MNLRSIVACVLGTVAAGATAFFIYSYSKLIEKEFAENLKKSRTDHQNSENDSSDDNVEEAIAEIYDPTIEDDSIPLENEEEQQLPESEEQEIGEHQINDIIADISVAPCCDDTVKNVFGIDEYEHIDGPISEVNASEEPSQLHLATEEVANETPVLKEFEVDSVEETAEVVPKPVSEFSEETVEDLIVSNSEPIQNIDNQIEEVSEAVTPAEEVAEQLNIPVEANAEELVTPTEALSSSQGDIESASPLEAEVEASFEEAQPIEEISEDNQVNNDTEDVDTYNEDNSTIGDVAESHVISSSFVNAIPSEFEVVDQTESSIAHTAPAVDVIPSDILHESITSSVIDSGIDSSDKNQAQSSYKKKNKKKGGKH